MSEVSAKHGKRLAVVLSHPTQYFSPWFQHIVGHSDIELKVFYLWRFGVEHKTDRSFGHALKWDIPLLEGYESEFIPNVSSDPGTHHFLGLNNPGLVNALVAWKPDAVLMFGYNYLSHLKVLLSWRLRKVPMLQRGDSHDLSRGNGWKPKLKRFLRSLIFKRFAAFLAVGKANSAYLRKSGVAEQRIHFVPHCVDNQRFHSAKSQAEQDAKVWREELGISSDVRVILFAGKFEPNKLPLDLIAAFLQAMKQFETEGKISDAVLLLVGSGELEGKMLELAGSTLGRNIFFAGFQNQTQMPKVYATGDVFVLPSQNESWGLAINEAMNLGLPVIVSSHVGCGPDLVLNENTGWIFPAGSVGELATILQHVLAINPDELEKMGDAAFERVQWYSYQHASMALVEKLDSVLQHKTSGK